jgi:hypothetical protein
MSELADKPYILRVAEIIYSQIQEIREEYPNINNREAIQNFIETTKYIELSSGKFHDEWLAKLKENNNIDNETNKKVPDETIRLLVIQRDIMMKELIKISKLYETENNQLIEFSKKASNFLWRMCESYELWCKETNQKKLITLNILD